MNSQVTFYEYKKLGNDDSFRLLTLLPGRPGDSLKCRISHYALSGNPAVSRNSLLATNRGPDRSAGSSSTTKHFLSKPAYEALSYVWGPQDHQFDLFCEGYSLKIGSNLHAALCHVRRTNRERILWIDRICICQEDIEERGHQVSLMGQIFSIATSVIIWLGQDETDVLPAYDMLHRLDKIRCKRPGADLVPSIASYTTIKEEVELNSLKRLLNSPWFLRAWTFQEAIFAKSALVVCGTLSISWNTVAETLKLVEAKLPSDLGSPYSAEFISSTKRFFDIVNSRPPSGSKPSLVTSRKHFKRSTFELLTVRRSAEATDPRDKVFALVNVSSDKSNDARHRHYIWADQVEFIFHQPNYRMSLEQVYTAVARHTITVDKNLDILLSVEVPKNDPALPSWVPDWRQPLAEPYRQTCVLEADETSMRKGFRATLDSKIELMDHENAEHHAEYNGVIVREPRRLTVKGLRMVKIVQIGERCRELESVRFDRIVGDEGNWMSMARRCSMKGVYTPTGEKTEVAFTRTRLPFRHFSSILPSPVEEEVALTQSSSLKKRTEIYRNCGHRKFFTTEDGYFGLGPLTIRVADIVYLLLGSTVPVLLRPITPDTMTFVGEAYVHGLMDGEGCRKVWKKHNMKEYDWGIPSLEWVTLV
jgi:Heterokaryon incompatibility protein (HET)